MFFASNYFYAYQGSINTARFDGPTRALNAVLEGAGAIVGALMIGFFVLDSERIPRRTRGYIGLAVVILITIAVWVCGLVWQTTFERGSPDFVLYKINYKDAAYRTKGPLFFFCTSRARGVERAVLTRLADYFGDACYQALAYWIMSALTNDPFTLARFAGLYKAVQSAGSAGSFGMDAVGTPWLNELVSARHTVRILPGVDPPSASSRAGS